MTRRLTADPARACVTCGGPIPDGARADAERCSRACVQRAYRDRRAAEEAAYVITEEDRAAMRRAALAVPIPYADLPAGMTERDLSPEVRARVILARATRT